MTVRIAIIIGAIALAATMPVGAAEVENPTSPQDWSTADRIGFTERWNRANVLNLMRGAAGAQEYRTIGQRTDFYNWFDQIRKVHKHEIMWPAAAWVVAGQMRNLEDPVRAAALTARRIAMGRQVDSDRLLQFASEGNKAIFDDVFPRLKEVFDRGVLGRPLAGDEARAWDRDTLRREQFDVVQPVYQRTPEQIAPMAAELKDLATGSDVLVVAGIAIANALDFTGFIISPQSRYDHGMNVVIPVYKRFEAAIDGSRERRQHVRPDPTAGGMVQPPGKAEQDAEALRQREAEATRQAGEAARARAAAAAIAEQQRRQAMEDFQRRLRAEEDARRAEAERRRRAEEMRRAEAERRAQEERMRQEQQRRQEEAERQRRAEEMRKAEETRRAQEEQLRQANLRRQQEEAERQRQAEAARRAEEARRGVGYPGGGRGGGVPIGPLR